MLGQKNLGVKKIWGQKKIWSQNKIRVKKNLDQKNLDQKNLDTPVNEFHCHCIFLSRHQSFHNQIRF